MSFSDLLYLLPICLIALIILILFWWFFGLSLFHSIDRNLRRCPSCKRGAAGAITDTEIENLGVRVDQEKLTTLRYKKERVTDQYLCERCGHTWEKTFEREVQLPVQNSSDS